MVNPSATDMDLVLCKPVGEKTTLNVKMVDGEPVTEVIEGVGHSFKKRPHPTASGVFNGWICSRCHHLEPFNATEQAQEEAGTLAMARV